jgi:uncharacterized membrane protein YoaK (UPF0700 family)
MISVLTEIRETLFPPAGSRDGPLPPILLGLTVVTGLVDSFSYLVLGHVFVANMTGNVVFLAFALAGAKGFSTGFSLVAITAFVFGSFSSGWMHSHIAHHRGLILGYSAVLKIFLIGIAFILVILAPKPLSEIINYGLIIALGISMGIQNAAARKLAVPDLTTTVLTLTITGIGADNHFAGGSGSKFGRRFLSISSMFVGALVGAIMILYVSLIYPLMIALIIVTIVAIATRLLARGTPAWVKPV